MIRKYYPPEIDYWIGIKDSVELKLLQRFRRISKDTCWYGKWRVMKQLPKNEEERRRAYNILHRIHFRLDILRYNLNNKNSKVLLFNFKYNNRPVDKDFKSISNIAVSKIIGDYDY